VKAFEVFGMQLSDIQTPLVVGLQLAVDQGDHEVVKEEI